MLYIAKRATFTIAKGQKIMKKYLLTTAFCIATLGSFAIHSGAQADDLAKYQGKTISIEEAAKIAGDHVGGTVIEVDFDDSDSSNQGKAVFEVEVVKDGVEHEVKLDAETGAIVKTKIDD